jgi:hypothetical protein
MNYRSLYFFSIFTTLYNIAYLIIYLLERFNSIPIFLKNSNFVIILAFLPPIVFLFQFTFVIFLFVKYRRNRFNGFWLIMLSIINLLFLTVTSIGTMMTIDFLKGN